MHDVERYCIPQTATIGDALAVIDTGAIGMCFVVDERRILQAVISDGDIRRAILRGSTVASAVSDCANAHPVSAPYDLPAEAVHALFLNHPSVKVIPLVDARGCIVDLARYSQNVSFPVARPVFQGNELKYVTDAVLSGWVSSSGPYVNRFEASFAKFCGVKYALSCSNGTAALHLALLSLGIGPGDEVIVPALTFIATANVVRYVGATPVLADAESDYWQVSPERVEAAITAKTKAIIPVHLYGHPANMPAIRAIAKQHHLAVIEDAAEAQGAEMEQKKVGSWGDLGTFSFFGNKIMTTGEGGMVTTERADLFEKMKVLRDHGMSPTRRYYHEVLGYNYRMTNLQAALGLAQLERIDEILTRKLRIAEWYRAHLLGTRGLTLHPHATGVKNVYWMYSILVDPEVAGCTRDRLMDALKARRIETRPFFPPIHEQPIYRTYRSQSFPNADRLAQQGLNMPSSVDLNEASVAIIAENIRQVLGATRA